MVCNPDKCEHIRITNKRNVIQTSYDINRHTSKGTSKAKYLGVNIDSKLSLNSYIYIVTKNGQPENSIPSQKSVKLSKGYEGQMLQVHSSSIARVSVYDMGPCNKGQHCQIGVCTEACRQVLLQ